MPTRPSSSSAGSALAPGPWTWLRQVHGARRRDRRPARRPRRSRGRCRRDRHGPARSSPSTPPTAPRSCWPSADGTVVGAAHAGWRGVVAGVLERTVEEMAALGASGVTARVGPHIRARCYEFGADELDEVARSYGDAVRADHRVGHPRPRRLCSGAGCARRPRRPGGRRRRVHGLRTRPAVVPPGPRGPRPHGRRHRHRRPGSGRVTVRAADVSVALERVLDRVADAGGDPEALTVVAVTKGFGARGARSPRSGRGWSTSARTTPRSCRTRPGRGRSRRPPRSPVALHRPPAVQQGPLVAEQASAAGRAWTGRRWWTRSPSGRRAPGSWSR